RYGTRIRSHDQDLSEVAAPQPDLVEQEPQQAAAKDRRGRAHQPKQRKETRLVYTQAEETADQEQHHRGKRSRRQNVESFGAFAREALGLVQTHKGEQRMPNQEQTCEQKEVPHGDPQGQKLRERGGADAMQACHSSGKE